MSTAVAVERVRRRLAFAARDLEMAISFYEAARIPHRRADVQARFSDTEAGHTFVALRSAALFQTALSVMRLWDRRDDTASLVTIARELESHDLLDAISKDAALRQGHLWGSAVAKSTHEDLVSLRERIAKMKEGRLRGPLDRLRAYRDKRLAHRDPFESSKAGLARTAMVTDVAFVLAASCYIVRRLRLAIDFIIDNPRAYRMIRRRYAEAFWAIPIRAERHDDD